MCFNVTSRPFSAQSSVDDDSDFEYEAMGRTKVDKNGDFSNWASTAQSTPAKYFTPETVAEVEDILAQVCC